MGSVDLVSLKETIARLPENDRREVSAFIIRMGQETESWRVETARRLDQMASGNVVSVADLRRQLDDA